MKVSTTAQPASASQSEYARSVNRRSRVILATGAVLAASGVLVATLFVTGVLHTGPTLSIRNDETRTISLICDDSYRIAPGHTAAMRLNPDSDGHVCRAVGTRAAVAAGELCINDADYRDGQRVKISEVLKSRCP